MRSSSNPKKGNASTGHACFDNTTYAQAQKLYTRHSEHVDLICSFVETQIIPILGEDRLHLLDVGAGPGNITRRLAQHFSNVEVIEPDQNPDYLSAYSKEPPFTLNPAQTIEEANISRSTYDLILCLHILYHVPIDEWGDCLKKLCHGLRHPSGKLIVALTAPGGKWFDFQLSLRPGLGSKFHSGTLCKILEKAGLKYEVHLQKVRVVVPAEKSGEFHNLARLYSITGCWSAQDWNNLSIDEQESIGEKIDAFIQNECFAKDGDGYSIEFDDEYAVVSP